MLPFFLIFNKIQSPEGIFNDIIIGLENWCIAFNNFFLILCQFLKYIFVFILLFIGILTLSRMRGVYRDVRLKGVEKEEDLFMKPRLIMGCLYIVLGFGILFNYITYFLIWILDPLPDRLIYSFIDFSGIDPFYMNRIIDISASQYPHEKTLYYCFSLISLMSVIDIFLSLWYLINNNRIIHNPRRTFEFLICGITGCILFGFTPGFVFFL